MVSMRVVKTSMSEVGDPGSEVGPELGEILKRTRAPSDRPIQFRCIVKTFSGHSPSSRMPCRRSSAYCVILKNHCSRSRVVTGVPQRQQPPSTTCSFASTVLQLGHQLTLERLRYASPFSSIFRKSHWFHL